MHWTTTLSSAVCKAFAAALIVSAGSLAQGADYPDRPIKIIVPFPAGSGTDTSARITGQTITEQTKQAVVIDNRAGASGFIAAQAAAAAPPDGYTVFITTNTTHAANAALFKKLPYDPIKDFAPVSLLGKSGLVLVVRPDSPYKSAGDLIKYARANPEKLTFAGGSSSTRIAGEMFKEAAGSRAVYVPYKGVPQALSDLIGGQFDFMIADVNPALPLIQQGKLKALAVTTARRFGLLPDVPTLAESGLPGFEMVAWSAAFVPAGTPRPIIDRLNQLIRAGQKSKTYQEFTARAGGEAAAGTPEELAAYVRSETDKWARAVKAAGIEPE